MFPVNPPVDFWVCPLGTTGRGFAVERFGFWVVAWKADPAFAYEFAFANAFELALAVE